MKKLIFLAALLAASVATAQNPFYIRDSSTTLLKWYDETGTQRWGPTTAAGTDTFASEAIYCAPYIAARDTFSQITLSYALVPGDTVHYTVAIQTGHPITGQNGFYAPGWGALSNGVINASVSVDSIVSVLAGQTYPGTGGTIPFKNTLFQPLGLPTYFRYVLLPYKVADATMNGAETTLFRRFRFIMVMPK